MKTDFESMLVPFTGGRLAADPNNRSHGDGWFESVRRSPKSGNLVCFLSVPLPARCRGDKGCLAFFFIFFSIRQKYLTAALVYNYPGIGICNLPFVWYSPPRN